jgi:hypothetical protein
VHRRHQYPQIFKNLHPLAHGPNQQERVLFTLNVGAQVVVGVAAVAAVLIILLAGPVVVAVQERTSCLEPLVWGQQYQ